MSIINQINNNFFLNAINNIQAIFNNEYDNVFKITCKTNNNVFEEWQTTISSCFFNANGCCVSLKDIILNNFDENTNKNIVDNLKVFIFEKLYTANIFCNDNIIEILNFFTDSDCFYDLCDLILLTDKINILNENTNTKISNLSFNNLKYLTQSFYICNNFFGFENIFKDYFETNIHFVLFKNSDNTTWIKILLDLDYFKIDETELKTSHYKNIIDIFDLFYPFIPCFIKQD